MESPQRQHDVPNISDYKVVVTNDNTALEKEVKPLLTQGWSLQGGASISYESVAGSLHGPTCLFVQTLVKYE